MFSQAIKLEQKVITENKSKFILVSVLNKVVIKHFFLLQTGYLNVRTKYSILLHYSQSIKYKRSFLFILSDNLLAIMNAVMILGEISLVKSLLLMIYFLS